ncbi:MAG: phosphoribosylanthranilate isomerase, partial [Clostridia bacterium]|nr:phosphoribosylanthranilate isomerase [Clostridia bacterium]
MTKIKICGLTRPQDIEAVNEALPDYIGFVFAPSPRRVTPLQAKELIIRLDSRIPAVGVFANAPVEVVAALFKDGFFDLAQLHGDEDAAYIEDLKMRCGCAVIRAVRVQNPQQILEAQALPCDYLLLDTYQKGVPGGTGERFDWSLIPPLSKPYFLAGGINLQNIEEAASLSPYCLDISSGAETEGLKDPEKIKQLE